MGLSEETSELPSNRQQQSNPGNGDTLFVWLLQRAEADLGVLQLLSIRETKRADQIKQLEDTLINQVDRLRHQLSESHNTEFGELKLKLFECSDHIKRLEAAHTRQADVKTSVKEELSTLREEFRACKTELQARCFGVDSLKEFFVSRTQALHQQLHDNITELHATREELCHFKSEHQSLLERITQTESTTSKTRTLAFSNAQQLQQYTNDLTNEIIALNVVVNEIKDRSSEAITYPESLLAEVTQNIQKQIDTIQQQLNHDSDVQHQRDGQLARLDATTAALADRIHKSESLYSQTLALVNSYNDSNAPFRDQITKELADLRSHITDALNGTQRINESDVMLRNTLEQLEHHAAQRLALQEERTANLEQSIEQLSSTIPAEIAQLQGLIAHRLSALESGYEELLNTKPQIRLLEQRALRSESEAQEAQSHANANLIKLNALETDWNSRFNTLQIELSKLAESQNRVRPPEELREIEQDIKGRLDHINRELAVEREGFNHWAHGLRTSFAAELSAIQTRISERQTQLEHNYDRLEHRETIVNANIKRLDTQLQNMNLEQEHGRWNTLVSELNTLRNRTTDLESKTRKANDRIITAGERTDESLAVITTKLGAVENAIERCSLPAFESITRPLQDKFERAFRDAQEQAVRQANDFDQRDSARAEQFEQVVQALKRDMEVFKTTLDHKQDVLSPSHPILATFEESILSRLTEIELKLENKLTLAESQNIDRSLQAQALTDKLQADIANIKITVYDNSPVCFDTPSTHELENSFAATIYELQQQVTQRIKAFDNWEANITHKLEETIASLKTEMAALDATHIDETRIKSLLDPVLCELEERISATLVDLRQEMTQEVSRANRRDLELLELNQKCDSLIQRAATFSVSGQSANHTTIAEPSSTSVSPKPNTTNTLLANGKHHGFAGDNQVSGDKEQLTKLQERMSSEIERVRAQLKEKNSRWKVRKSGS